MNFSQFSPISCELREIANADYRISRRIVIIAAFELRLLPLHSEPPPRPSSLDGAVAGLRRTGDRSGGLPAPCRRPLPRPGGGGFRRPPVDSMAAEAPRRLPLLPRGIQNDNVQQQIQSQPAADGEARRRLLRAERQSARRLQRDSRRNRADPAMAETVRHSTLRLRQPEKHRRGPIPSRQKSPSRFSNRNARREAIELYIRAEKPLLRPQQCEPRAENSRPFQVPFMERLEVMVRRQAAAGDRK